MEYIVYVLFSGRDCKLYIGQTKNLAKRLLEHSLGQVKSTRNRRPLLLVRKEVFPLRSAAMKREKFLKSLYGHKERTRILKEFLSDALNS